MRCVDRATCPGPKVVEDKSDHLARQRRHRRRHKRPRRWRRRRRERGHRHRPRRRRRWQRGRRGRHRPYRLRRKRLRRPRRRLRRLGGAVDAVQKRKPGQLLCQERLVASLRLYPSTQTAYRTFWKLAAAGHVKHSGRRVLRQTISAGLRSAREPKAHSLLICWMISRVVRLLWPRVPREFMEAGFGDHTIPPSPIWDGRERVALASGDADP